MEILGLAFVFVILIFGFLVYVRFANNAAPDNPVELYLEPKIASAFTDTLLHTTVDCGSYGKRILRDLLIDCVSNHDSGAALQQCELPKDFVAHPYTYLWDPDNPVPEGDMTTRNSCETFALFENITANLTLERWGKAFYITGCIQGAGDPNCPDLPGYEDILPTYLQVSRLQYPQPTLGIPVCNQTVDSYRSRSQPLPLTQGAGNLVIQTSICR